MPGLAKRVLMPAKACQGSLFNMYFAKGHSGTWDTPWKKQYYTQCILSYSNITTDRRLRFYSKSPPWLACYSLFVCLCWGVCLFCFVVFFWGGGAVLFNAHHCPRSNRLFSSDYETGDLPLSQYSLILVSLSLFPMLLMA